MAWKKLKVYVIELLLFFCIVAFVCGTYLLTDTITIRWCALSIILLLLIATWMCCYIFSFVPFAFRVIMDLILHDYQTLEGKFIESFIFKSSSLLSTKRFPPTRGKTELAETLYYKIIVETNQELVMLTTSEFVFLEKGTIYSFLVGKRSNALIRHEPRHGDGSSVLMGSKVR